MFGHLRDAYTDYMSAKEMNEQSAEKSKEPCMKIVQMFNFLSQLCEGHNKKAQNMLREQVRWLRAVGRRRRRGTKGPGLVHTPHHTPHSHTSSLQPHALKTCNLFAESLDLAILLGKNMPEVRSMNDFEGELLEATMTFLVEVLQGPCEGNQDFVARNPKILGVCKNILSCPFKRIRDGSLRWRLAHNATAFLCALLESRGSNLEVHTLLINSLPYELVMAKLTEVAQMETKLAHVNSGWIPKDVEDMSREEKRNNKLGMRGDTYYSKMDGLNWASEHVHSEWKEKELVAKSEREEAHKWRQELMDDFRER